MGSPTISVLLVLVVLGYRNPVFWLIGAVLLLLHLRFGGAPAPGRTRQRTDFSYRAYRARRDRQARWERRYERERPPSGTRRRGA